jgi:hypothetical protein
MAIATSEPPIRPRAPTIPAHQLSDIKRAHRDEKHCEHIQFDAHGGWPSPGD